MSLGYSKCFTYIVSLWQFSKAGDYHFSHLADEKIEETVIKLLAQDRSSGQEYLSKSYFVSF